MKDTALNKESKSADSWLCTLEQTTEPQFPYLKNTHMPVYVCVHAVIFKGPPILTLCASKSAVFLPGFTLESPGDL